MKAIQFNLSIPRYVLGLGLGKLSSDFYWSGLTCTQLNNIPEPSLPDNDWVVVKTRLGGICGTDMSAVKLTASTYSTPLVTFPFVLGHENIGYIEKIGPSVTNWEVGERVVVVGVKGEMSAVVKSTSGEDDRQVPVVMASAVHV